MGTAVVGGMVTATALGLFLIPVLFVVIEQMQTISRLGNGEQESADIQSAD
jgi:Cu/Ag efflux pump CusA